MRAERILAIAKRDLSIEFKGRRAWLLPSVAMIVLGPIVFAPSMDDAGAALAPIRVTGDVPEQVLEIKRVEEVPRRAMLRFEAPSADNDNRWILHGDYLPADIREALEATGPGIRTEIVDLYKVEPPNRSLFLALIAASVLTGAISQSIPGERTNSTLEGLLTASISRAELVLGKWLAWGGYGGGLAILAALGTMLAGRQAPGWWLLPLPMVSFGTVALGFFLVRRANDVIGGATVAIRVLPAALTVLGLSAWYLGTWNPLLGAALPLGGALFAAGDVWPGPAPALLATASTLLASLGMLALTARDLTTAERVEDDRGRRAALSASGLAALGWWGGVVGPLMWAAGGAPELMSSLSPERGVRAGTLTIALIVLIKLARSSRPLAAVGLTAPSAALWLPAVLAGAMLLPVAWTADLITPPTHPVWLEVRQRMTTALQPGMDTPFVLLAAVLSQEALFRGWLRQRLGDLAQLGLFVLVFSPMDPVSGLLVGAFATLLTAAAGGSVLPAVLARVLFGLGAFLSLPSLPPAPALFASLAALGVLAGVLWGTGRAPTFLPPGGVEPEAT